MTGPDGAERRVLNKKATMLVQQKQEMIREAFQEWIFQDMDRREKLCRIYNDRYNSIRPREYDGSHIKFQGMTPEITLMPHQKNAIAHILYGHNTLLAHCVGAGKTFQMIAAYLGKKDHTTVIHGVEKIEEKIQTDEDLRNKIETIQKKLTPS